MALNPLYIYFKTIQSSAQLSHRMHVDLAYFEHVQNLLNVVLSIQCSLERVLIVLLFPCMKCLCRYAIKIDIIPYPVSIFSDPILHESGQFRGRTV